MSTDKRDISHVEIELGEDDLGEGVLHGRTASAVEALGVAEQVQGRQEELAAGVELGCGVGQLSLDLCPLGCDGLKLLLDLGLRPARLADQVKVVLFLGIQFAEMGFEALLEGVDAAEFAQHRVVELAAYVGSELVAEAHRGVVQLDGFLNVLHFEVGLVTAAGLTAPAHEVEVGAAVAFAGGDDEALTAAPAPDQAL